VYKACLLGTAMVLVQAAPARAGDKVLVAPVPDWVLPQDRKAPPGNLPVFDEQVRVEGGTVTAFIDTDTLISSPEVLNQRGTISIGWQPSQGDLTIHRIDIVRDGKVIDALQGGAGITVLRREAGLERLSVDGALTAVKHIEDLQVGDHLRMTLSISAQDKVLAGNAQDALVLLPAPTKLDYGRARLVWRTAQPLHLKPLVPGVTVQPRAIDATWSEVVVPLPIAKMPEMPKAVPVRFQPLPVLQFSSFADWAGVVQVMAPLYQVKDSIAPGSELAKRVDAIRQRSTDPVVRMADALQLVQDEVRYQLIALGTGNYVPQRPADTWTKRYGDCKAKTLLLMAVLDQLGITAEPVLASIKRGDAVGEMLPAAMAFDHVFVRAEVNGESFWLDGTGLGSRLADIRDVPRFGKVLPLFTGGGKLLELPRRATARKAVDIDVTYDLTAGPHLPAPYRMTIRYEGPASVRNRVQPNANYDDELTKFAERQATKWVGSNLIGEVKGTYDAASAVWSISTEGVVYPNWNYSDGHYGWPLSPVLQIDYDAPRDRAAWRSLPALIDDPWTAQVHSTILLPDGGKAVALSGDTDRRVSLPAVEWTRHAMLAGGKVIEDIASRESGMEVPADAVSTTGRTIRQAMDGLLHVDLAASYPEKWADVPVRAGLPAVARVRALFDARVAAKPDDADRLGDRAAFRKALFDWNGAEADYTKAIAIDASAARYLSRSYLRSLRADHAGALTDAKAAYDLEEGNKDVRDQLAKQLSEAGKVDEALDLLPPDPDPTSDEGLQTLLYRVELLETGDRHADAITLLDGLIEKRARSAELHNARCWFLALRNDSLDQALEDCNKAIELSSNPATYLDSRGMVHYRAGRYTEAAADYAAALADSPAMPSSLFMSGLVARKLGKKTEGDAAIAAARKIHPDIDHFYARYGIAG